VALFSPSGGALLRVLSLVCINCSIRQDETEEEGTTSAEHLLGEGGHVTSMMLSLESIILSQRLRMSEIPSSYSRRKESSMVWAFVFSFMMNLKVQS
jgi:hypothetical protein